MKSGMLRIGLTVSFALSLVLALSATAHADDGITREELLRTVESYYDGRIDLTEVHAALHRYRGVDSPSTCPSGRKSVGVIGVVNEGQSIRVTDVTSADGGVAVTIRIVGTSNPDPGTPTIAVASGCSGG